MNAPNHQEPSPVYPSTKSAELLMGVRGCLALIKLYRRYLSPLKPPSCRFTPTCSQYALDAYIQLGVIRGTWRTFTRLVRCHPWHPGGHDPVIHHAKDNKKKT
jgi:hypothetical protein